MIKMLIILVAGTLESYLFAWWTLSANRKQIYISSLLMFIYMSTYLFILDIAFKDSNSKLMLLTYAIACGLGNYLRVRYEKKHKEKRS